MCFCLRDRAGCLDPLPREFLARRCGGSPGGLGRTRVRVDLARAHLLVRPGGPNAVLGICLQRPCRTRHQAWGLPEAMAPDSSDR